MSDNGTVSGLITGFIVGAAIGLAIGFLYAPQAGQETRALIREKAEKTKEKAEDIIEEARERAKRIIADARGQSASTAIRPMSFSGLYPFNKHRFDTTHGASSNLSAKVLHF